MEGFKITCLKCGNEQVINPSMDFEGVYIYPSGYEGQIGIYCDKCENDIEAI